MNADVMEPMTSREQEDARMVEAAYKHLVDTYLQSRHRKHTEIIEKAFNFARQAHKGVRRLSGEPYIMHPIAVAQIACEEIGLGSTSICAALLHDVVEDTDYTVEDIERTHQGVGWNIRRQGVGTGREHQEVAPPHE